MRMENGYHQNNMVEQPLANRHNNPGNLRDPKLGTFRQFSTPQDGYAALLNDLHGKQTATTTTGLGPSSTLADFAKTWAPETDGNDPGQYTANLANFMGVRPDAQLSQLDLGKWAEAIAKAEGYQSDKWSHTPDTLAVADTAETASSNPTPIKKPDASLGDHLEERVRDLSDAVKLGTSGSFHGALSGIVQGLGAGAGAINDVIGAGIEKIPGVKAAEGVVGGIVGKLANTGVGKKVTGAYGKLPEELRKDISSVGNIGGLVGGGLGAKKLIEGGLAKAAGKDALSAVVDDLSPNLTKTGTAKAIAKRGTEKSLLTGEISTATDPAVVESAKAVHETVPNFSKLKTFSDKVNAVQDGISSTAKELRTNLSGDIQAILSPEDLTNLEKTIKTEISKNPVLVGDAGTQAQRIFDHFKELLPKGKDITMNEVLDARQGLDRWIEKIKGTNAFDPKTENAFSTALRAVRQGANNIMESKVPDAGVKKLLRKQTLLYDAVENLSPKAAKEVGSTRLSRLIDRHPASIGLAKKAALAGGAIASTGLGFKLAQK